MRIDVETDGGGGERERNPVCGEERPQLSEGDDRTHAGCRAGGCRIDPPDARMRMRAAQECRMQQPRQFDVVHEGTLPAQEPRVLDARDAAPDQA